MTNIGRTQSDNKGSLLNCALDYAAQGLAVCPVLGKEPKYEGGHGWYDATNDPAKVRRLFRSRRHTGLGIATGKVSGVWVLDIDGPQGLKALRELISLHGSLPPTAVGLTGGGGWHLLFRWEPGCERLKNSVKFLPGLDVRTTGGGIVVPPSVHPDTGCLYAWRDGPLVVAELPAAPDWLIDRAAPAPVPVRPARMADNGTVGDMAEYVRGALRSAAQRIVSAGKGVQRHTLNREAVSIGANFVATGRCDRRVAADWLVSAGMAMTNHTKVRWTQKQIVAVVESGLDYGAAHSRHAA